MFLNRKHQYYQNDLSYPKQSTYLMKSTSNYRGHFSQDQNKKNFHLCGNTKYLSSQSNLEKERRAGGIRLPDFRLYSKATNSMVLVHKPKYRSMEQVKKSTDKPTCLSAGVQPQWIQGNSKHEPAQVRRNLFIY